jgi:hypothetical protein
MSQRNWDVVIAGDGLGGATLGRSLAMHGARVLIGIDQTRSSTRY